ncbi:uncharacterized protein [Dermacentor andersoni]|uniref:uncharacterized protein n=1 Tax=Dermacentor andersoni TaxID=34620 RepID=UPI002415C2FA|nr:uncharacterized protein LOC129385829 [Dermacentor andersoni]
MRIRKADTMCGMSIFQVTYVVFFLGTLTLQAKGHRNSPYIKERLQREKCEFTNQCKYGLCCVKKGPSGPMCLPVGKLGEKCTTKAVEGVYRMRCPCADHARCHVKSHICVSPRIRLNSTMGASKTPNKKWTSLSDAVVSTAQGNFPVFGVDKPQGEKCEFTSQCQHGLCCLYKGSDGPTCQPVGKIGERCTTEAVHGVYTIRCPCVDHARCHVETNICVSARIGLNSTIAAFKSSNKKWTSSSCECAHCQVLANFLEPECPCCREMGASVSLPQPQGCMTEHPDFNLLCLNIAVLRVAYLELRSWGHTVNDAMYK